MIIVSLKMKKLSKSIKKYLADNIPISKSRLEGQDCQSHHQTVAYPQMQQDNNSIYYDLK